MSYFTLFLPSFLKSVIMLRFKQGNKNKCMLKKYREQSEIMKARVIK